MTQLTNCSKNAIIIMAVIFIILSAINLVLTLIGNKDINNYFIDIDIAMILFGILLSLSVFRIKWIRYIVSTFIVLLFFIFIYEYNIENVRKKVLDFYYFSTLILFLIMLQTIFKVYWGINILNICCSEACKQINFKVIYFNIFIMERDINKN